MRSWLPKSSSSPQSSSRVFVVSRCVTLEPDTVSSMTHKRHRKQEIRSYLGLPQAPLSNPFFISSGDQICLTALCTCRNILFCTLLCSRHQGGRDLASLSIKFKVYYTALCPSTLTRLFPCSSYTPVYGKGSAVVLYIPILCFPIPELFLKR